MGLNYCLLTARTVAYSAHNLLGTKSFYVRAAIRAHLEDLEDAYAADDALKDFEASGRKSRPLADLVREVGFTEADIAEGRARNVEP